jgi:orotate phosphoribosyltransferase
MLTESEERLADKLWEIGSIQFNFVDRYRLKMHDTHSERPWSPVYINLRTNQHPVPEKRGPLDDETLNMIGNEFALLLDNLHWNFELFADIPDAGTPFGDLIAEQLHWQGDDFRLHLIKTTNPDGTRFISGLKENLWQPNQSVLLVDDLLTGADTKLEAANVLKRAGFAVWHVMVLIDRCQGGVKQLHNAGLDVSAVMTLPDMLEYYVRTGKITALQELDVLDYLVLSATWE